MENCLKRSARRAKKPALQVLSNHRGWSPRGSSSPPQNGLRLSTSRFQRPYARKKNRPPPGASLPERHSSPKPQPTLPRPKILDRDPGLQGEQRRLFRVAQHIPAAKRFPATAVPSHLPRHTSPRFKGLGPAPRPNGRPPPPPPIPSHGQRITTFFVRKRHSPGAFLVPPAQKIKTRQVFFFFPGASWAVVRAARPYVHRRHPAPCPTGRAMKKKGRRSPLSPRQQIVVGPPESKTRPPSAESFQDHLPETVPSWTANRGRSTPSRRWAPTQRRSRAGCTRFVPSRKTPRHKVPRGGACTPYNSFSLECDPPSVAPPGEKCLQQMSSPNLNDPALPLPPCPEEICAAQSKPAAVPPPALKGASNYSTSPSRPGGRFLAPIPVSAT